MIYHMYILHGISLVNAAEGGRFVIVLIDFHKLFNRTAFGILNSFDILNSKNEKTLKPY